MPKIPGKSEFQYYGSLDEVRQSITFFSSKLEELSEVKKATNNFINRRILKMRTEAALNAITMRSKNLKVKKIVAPTTAPKVNPVLQSHFKAIQDVLDLRTEADHIYRSLKYQFQGFPQTKRMLKDADELRKLMDTNFRELIKQAKAASNGVFPKWFSDLAEKVRQELDEKFKNKFEPDAKKGEDANKSTIRKLVAPMPDGKIYYLYYIRYKNLKDSKGSIHPNYYIVLTVIEGPDGSMVNLENPAEPYDVKSQPVYVSTYASFEVPGKGLEFEGHAHGFTDTVRRIGDLLAAENFGSAIAPIKLPLNKEEVDFKNDLVDKTYVNEDSIVVQFRKKVSNKAAIAEVPNLIAELNSMLFKSKYGDDTGNTSLPVDRLHHDVELMKRGGSSPNVDREPPQKASRSLPKINYRMTTKGGQPAVEFTFSLPSGFRMLHVSPHDEQILRDHYHMNETDIEKFKRKFMYNIPQRAR